MQTRNRNLPAFVAPDGSVVRASAPMPDVPDRPDGILPPPHQPTVALAGTGWVTQYRPDLGRPAGGDQIVAFTGPMYIEHGVETAVTDPDGPDGVHAGAFKVGFYAGIGSVVALGSFAADDPSDLVRVMYMTKDGPVPVGAAVAAKFLESAPSALRDETPAELRPGLAPIAYASERQRVARAERINATLRLADTMATRAMVQGTPVPRHTDVQAMAEIVRYVDTRRQENEQLAARREEMLKRARRRTL